MTYKNIFHILLPLLLSWQVAAQSNLAIGQWKSHLSYRSGIQVTQSDDKIFYAAQRGLFSIDKEDLSVRFLSRENGLSDVRASKLFYDAFNNQVIIIYDDNNIDFLKNTGIVNIPFIQTNTSILGSKTINDFYASAKNFALWATDFGLSLIHI